MPKKLSALKVLSSIFDNEEAGVPSDDEEDCVELNESSNSDLENDKLNRIYHVKTAPGTDRMP